MVKKVMQVTWEVMEEGKVGAPGVCSMQGNSTVKEAWDGLGVSAKMVWHLLSTHGMRMERDRRGQGALGVDVPQEFVGVVNRWQWAQVMQEAEDREGKVKWLLVVQGGGQGYGQGRWLEWKSKEGYRMVAVGNQWEKGIWVGEEWESQ